MNLKYLKLIASLPGAKLMHRGDEKTVLRFEFDGGIGGVMPSRDTGNDGVPASSQWSESRMNVDVDLPDTAVQDSATKSNNPAVSG